MRYFFGFLVAIGLIIFIIILMFGGGSKPRVATLKPGQRLETYSNTDAEVRMTIDGPVNADQSHQQVRITVSGSEVVYQQISGYDGNAVNTQTFHNNTDSYYTFLRALGFAGFQQGDTSKSLKDERGRCPLGARYIFDMDQDGTNMEHFWTTTCDNKTKTYLGNLPGTIMLFQAQVPGYRALTDNLQTIPR